MNSPNPRAKMLLIGGLVLNREPLCSLSQQHSDIQFVDINSFLAPFSLSDIVLHLQQRLTSAAQPLTVVGYSCGGLVAIMLARELPQLVTRLILINSTPYFLSAANWHGISQHNFQRLTTKLTTLPLAQFKHHFSCLALYPQRTQAIKLLKVQSEYCNKDNLSNWLEIIATSDLREHFAQIMLPILYLNAANDQLLGKTNTFNHPTLSAHPLADSSHAALNPAALLNHIARFMP